MCSTPAWRTQSRLDAERDLGDHNALVVECATRRTISDLPVDRFCSAAGAFCCLPRTFRGLPRSLGASTS
eukprot:1577847-Heterocapsa_arctica.AAC.1